MSHPPGRTAAPSAVTSQFAVNGMLPRRVLYPETEEEAVGMLNEARAQGQSVIPAGGGTLLHVGNAPERYDLALSTSKLTGIVEYNPADLTLVVRGGTPISEVDAALVEHGQFLPLAPPFAERATVGGVLASNAGVFWRTAYGSARDWVIGMRMALPSGQLARSGGRVVKNVAGYDLAKLFIGSYGSLGVIVEAAFKVSPLPAVTQTIAVDAPHLPEAFDLAARIRQIRHGVLSLAVLDQSLGRQVGRPGITVVIVAGGAKRAVGGITEMIQALAPNIHLLSEREAKEVQDSLQNVPATAQWKVSTPPAVTHKLSALNTEVALFYPAVGLSFLSIAEPPGEQIEGIRTAARKHGGSAVILRPYTAHSGDDVWGPPEPELSLMRKVKDVFDPERVMSPGRFVGHL